MSNETVTAPVPLYPVSRNDITIELVQKDITKGKNKGDTYPSFIPKTEEDWTALFGFIGTDTLRQWTLGKFNTVAANLKRENTSDDGTFDQVSFIKNIQELSARGESSKELIARILSMRESMTELADEMVEMIQSAAPIEEIEKVALARQRQMAEFKMVCEALESKKRKTKEEEEEVSAVLK